MDQSTPSDDQTPVNGHAELNNVVTSDRVAGSNEATKPSEQMDYQDSNTTQPAVSRTRSEEQDGGVTWTASEFIAHYKSPGWYALVGLAAALIGGLVWLTGRDIFMAVLVFVVVLLLGFYGAHKPRQLTYELDSQGLTIGARRHLFGEFRAFSVVSEGPFSSIELVPLRRFAMYVTIYFDPNDENKIIGVMSEHLPIEEPRNDLLEQLMHRVRF
jgi:hypothetical protein